MVQPEYDPEVDNIDDIIQHDPFLNQDEETDQQAFKTVKVKGRTGLATITKQELEDLSDDDQIIDLFL